MSNQHCFYYYSVVNSSGGDSVKLGENITEGFKVVIKKLIQLNRRDTGEIMCEYHRGIHSDTKIVNRKSEWVNRNIYK